MPVLLGEKVLRATEIKIKPYKTLFLIILVLKEPVKMKFITSLKNQSKIINFIFKCTGGIV